MHSETESTRPTTESRRRLHLIRRWAWALTSLFGCLQAWAFRREINPDGVSYLDMASGSARDWHALINGYWSPMYPALLRTAQILSGDNRVNELTVVHFLNVLLLLGTLASFEFFLSSLLKWLQSATDDSDNRQWLPEEAWWIVGYTLFLWIALTSGIVTLFTPDLLVAAIVFLASGMIARIASADAHWESFALLGLILAVGYLSKAVMFPLAFIFLAVAGLQMRNLKRTAPRVFLSLVIFFAVSCPYLLALRQAKGRWTFGDTGHLNYAAFTGGLTSLVHWQGGPGGLGFPVHPTREVVDAPPTFEFASPIAGTYPPWNDPSYWLWGMKVRPSLRGQCSVLIASLEAYMDLFAQMGALWVGILVLILLDGQARRFPQEVMRRWPVWFPAAAAFAMYAVVRVETRFVAAFILLLWAGIFAALRSKTDTRQQVQTVRVAWAIALVFGVGIAWTVARGLYRIASPKPAKDEIIARDLANLGIQPGDAVAFVGSALADVYWARLASLKIVAETPEGFWTATPEERETVIHAFATTGARVAVAVDIPRDAEATGWRPLPGTNFSAYLLSR